MTKTMPVCVRLGANCCIAVRCCSLKIIPRRECSWVLGISAVKGLSSIHDSVHYFRVHVSGEVDNLTLSVIGVGMSPFGGRGEGEGSKSYKHRSFLLTRPPCIQCSAVRVPVTVIDYNIELTIKPSFYARN